MVEEAGKIKITINMTDFRYSVKDNSAPTELYMTGSAYNWGKIWKQFVPVNDTKGAFWGIYYFAADDQVKFAPQADWGNDFGFAATISQASVDRAGLSDSDGNIKVGKAGWYLVYVSVIGDNRVVEFETPNVYLIGDTSMTVGTTSWQNKIYSPSRQMQTAHSSHRHSPRTESSVYAYTPKPPLPIGGEQNLLS